MTTLRDALNAGRPLVTVELRPPRAELESAAGIDAWIDTYHAVRGLTRQDVRVFLTDSAVGAQEENNLRHLVNNLGPDVERDLVVPFLTSKHSREFCLSYADQAVQHGFRSLVVLGGDRHVGRPRCVEHAWQLRADIRGYHPELELGGWANPYADTTRQVDYLVDPGFTGEFFLTQIVSHHALAPVERFLDECARRRVTHPGVFGVFYYRSRNPKTLAALSRFLPVPANAIAREFESGVTPVEMCARTVRALAEIGARHVYISNLPLARAAATLSSILEQVAVASR